MRFEMPKDFVAEFEHRQFKKPVTVLLPNGHEITPRGFTYCILKAKSGVVLREGLAWCRDSDQFNKSIGRQISLGRALKSWHKEDFIFASSIFSNVTFPDRFDKGGNSDE